MRAENEDQGESRERRLRMMFGGENWGGRLEEENSEWNKSKEKDVDED